jgi:hypothetical protein
MLLMYESLFQREKERVSDPHEMAEQTRRR